LNYSYLNGLYFNSGEFAESLYIGTKNQINFLSSHSYLNSQTTLLNLEISQKFYNAKKYAASVVAKERELPAILKLIKANSTPILKTFQSEAKFVDSLLELPNIASGLNEPAKTSSDFLTNSDDFKSINFKFRNFVDLEKKVDSAAADKIYLKSKSN
jgi:hypothetical protein